ncbi:MAG TPA: hypothetical protein VGS28_02610 [Candidatus Saccharimonadales bacterium]|nr:hypothetical protein [Candidatus Saccharimonadales bacterium]
MSRYQICISGAHSGDTIEYAHQLAYDLGKAIAEAGHTTTTGATIGLPRYGARGAKENGGLSVGFSPASSYREHVHTYRLPTKEFDYINFTGMDYVGRDVYLVRSSDALITVGGEVGSLHEFSTAVESHKVIAVLLGSGGLADFLPTLIDRLRVPHKEKIIFDTDAQRIVKRVIEALDKEYADFKDQLAGDVEEKPTNRKRGG